MPDSHPHALTLASDGAGFAARVAELERAHRDEAPPAPSAPPSSWLWRWLRGVLARSLPSPAVGPPPPIPLAAAGECTVTWIGHATVLLRYASARVLTDPCFADSLYTLRRARAAALPDGALENLDVVLISHAHADHLHRPSLRELGKSPTLIVPPRCPGVDRLGFRRVVELEPGERAEVNGIEITATAARHRVGLFGRGHAVGYVLRGDGPTVYFAGDTGYFSGFGEIGARFRPDVALLPISGYRPRALRTDHLSPLDALYALEDLGAELLVPIHHSAFALGYEPTSEPILWLRAIMQARGLLGRVAWLEPGESCVARRAET